MKSRSVFGWSWWRALLSVERIDVNTLSESMHDVFLSHRPGLFFFEPAKPLLQSLMSSVDSEVRYIRWTSDEDTLLLLAHQKYGASSTLWLDIRDKVFKDTNRSTASIRNRWKRKVRPVLQRQGRRRHRCRLCGAFLRGHTCHANSASQAIDRTTVALALDSSRAMILTTTEEETARMLCNVERFRVHAFSQTTEWNSVPIHFCV